jgi:hypothetical protein
MKILKDTKGLALFMSIVMMTIFLFFLSASLYLTRVDTKITSNLKLSTQALEVADAGIQHALALIPSGYDFDKELNCDPSCPLVPKSAFPSGSAFSYTVTARNDPLDAGGATDDTDSTFILASTAEGPAGTLKTVEAYVRRTVNPFTAPAAVYINATSATPFDSLFFDEDDLLVIDGHDTDPQDILDGLDDTAGSDPTPKFAVATTSAALTSTLQAEWNAGNYENLHYFCGEGGDCVTGIPSLGTTSELIDIDQVADKFIQHGSTVTLNGMISDDICSSPCQPCPSATPCELGTSANPQITYIKDPVGISSVLRGHVRGHGVLVVEGRTTIGDNFRFNGLVIHKRTDSSHYISLENSAWIYGSLLIGAYNGEAKFTIEDFVQLFYSSQALSMVQTNWGSIIPGPARVFAWQDK